MYVIGGEGSDGPLKDVWRSEDGAHWTMTEVWCIIYVYMFISPSPLALRIPSRSDFFF